MIYRIENIIKHLRDAQTSGKEYITEKELISMSVPKINNIDETIDLIEKGIKEAETDFVTLSEAERITGISRQTLYRWKDNGIIQMTRGSIKNGLYLSMLKQALMEIRDINGQNVTYVKYKYPDNK